MNDVLAAVTKAREVYETKSDKHAKARDWINTFASSVTQYASVFDVLAQADPLHAGLAWGAIKFVFMVCSYPRLEASRD
jgi:hypothetical protein